MALIGLAVKLLVSLALWPLAAALLVALARLAAHLHWLGGDLAWFAAGFVAYLAVQVLFWRPLFLYVMGHELTHALAAVLQGGQADDLHVSTKGGKVRVNRSNFLVNLAPYCFPLYTALVCAVWAVAADRFLPPLAALAGFTLAFHFALTLYSLRQHQSDIADTGWFFSLPVIVASNTLACVLLLRLVAPADAGLAGYFQDVWGLLGAGARGLLHRM